MEITEQTLADARRLGSIVLDALDVSEAPGPGLQAVLSASSGPVLVVCLETLTGVVALYAQTSPRMADDHRRAAAVLRDEILRRLEA